MQRMTESLEEYADIQDTKDYNEFKFKVKLWKIIGHHQKDNDSTFFTNLCAVLSRDNKLEQFKDWFVDLLIDLDLNEVSMDQITEISMLEIEVFAAK